jgi:hypothetical protein
MSASGPPTPSIAHFGNLTGSRLSPGLELLLNAHLYSLDVGVECEEFAVEVSLLLASSMSLVDLRWLIHKGYVRHLIEVDSSHSCSRQFIVQSSPAFAHSSCVLLTAAGVEVASQLLRTPVPDLVPVTPQAVPLYDTRRRELWCRELLVKRFRVPAPNQELILAAFQEEAWPSAIDDPLPQSHSVEPKRRLHDTIVALNRHRVNRTVRFFGDGTGLGIRWQPDNG